MAIKCMNVTNNDMGKRRACKSQLMSIFIKCTSTQQWIMRYANRLTANGECMWDSIWFIYRAHSVREACINRECTNAQRHRLWPIQMLTAYIGMRVHVPIWIHHNDWLHLKWHYYTSNEKYKMHTSILLSWYVRISANEKREYRSKNES